MGPVTRQDVQNIINTCQNRLFDRVASKQDVQTLSDILKSLLSTQQQNQQIMRQADYQRSQLTRRAMALEARIIQLEQEIRSYRDTLNKIAAAQVQPPRVTIQAPERVETGHEEQAAQYIYRPA